LPSTSKCTRFLTFLYSRLCNCGVFLDQAAQFANLDTSYITETMTRQVVAAVTQGGSFIADLQYFMGIGNADAANLNYFMAGATAGRLIKVLFDFTINN
jgi:hypothetical protein